MKILFILLQFLISFSSFADCTADVSFKEFVYESNLLKSNNPQELLSQYSKKTGVSAECTLEKTKSLIPQFVISWRNEANAKGCFSTPPKDTCPKESRDEIFGNITLLDAWSLHLKNHDGIPTQSLCQESLGVAPEAEGLTGDIADILSVMNKMRRLEDNLALKENCSESEVVDVSAHPQFQQFYKIYKKGNKATLEDYLKLWDEGNKNELDSPYFFSCQSKPWGAIDKKQKVSGLEYVVDECKPDVLYSWGSQKKLDTITANLPTGSEWRGDPNKRDGESYGLFMALTPAQTFGYGDVLMRLKFKKETPFTVGDTHVARAASGDEKIGVRSRTGDYYLDYTIDRSSYIESYSYGTPEIYDELVLDVQRFMSKKRAQAYITGAGLGMFSKDAGAWRDLEKQGIKNLTEHDIDGFDFSQKALKDRFRKLLAMIIKKKGRVHFQKGVCKSVKKHYETDKPTYFNPR